MAEGKTIGSLVIELIGRDKKLKASINNAERQMKAFADKMTKVYGGIEFPIDAPMKKMVEVMKEANRKAKIEGKVFGKTLDKMAAKMKAMTMSGGIISPLKVSPLKRQFINLASTIKSKMKSAMNVAGKAMTKFVSGAKRVLTGLKRFIFNWKTLVGGALVAAFGVKITRAITNFGKSIFKTGAMFENFGVTLGQLVKTPVNEFLDKLADKAKKTSLTFDDYVKSAISLVGVFGEGKEFSRIIDLTADLSSGLESLGVNADAVTRMFRKLKGGQIGEAFERLSEWGINWQEILGVMTPEDARKLGIGKVFDTIIKALESKYGGLASKAAKTATGMISNIQDFWLKFKRLIADSGFFDVIKSKLEGILQKFEQWDKEGKLKKWAQDISNVLSGMFKLVTGIVESISGIDLTVKGPVDSKKMTDAQKSVSDLQAQYDSLMEMLNQGYGEGGVKTFDDLLTQIDEVGAKLSGAKDELQNLTEKSARGEGTTEEKPAWVQNILDWIEKIKAEIKMIWDDFGSAWKGKDKRGARDAHGILPGGFEGIGRQLVKSIEDALNNIDWSAILRKIGENTAELTKIGVTLGKALGDGVEQGLAQNHPVLAWLWKKRDEIGLLATGPLGPAIAGIQGAIRLTGGLDNNSDGTVTEY